MDIAFSINGVPICLTYERWYHIIENHDELASYFYEVLEAVERPDMVLRGNHGSLKAFKNAGRRKWLAVVYREVTKRDGFVVTAYFVDKKPRGEVVWERR